MLEASPSPALLTAPEAGEDHKGNASSLNGTPEPAPEAEPEPPPSPVTEKMRKRLFALCRDHGVPYADVKAYMQQVIECTSSKELTVAQYARLIVALEDGRVTDWLLEQAELQAERAAIQAEAAA
jgi:hypothetical protein